MANTIREDDMPPSGFNRKALKGLLLFLGSCYEDLLEEVRSGKYKTYEEAIDHETAQIKKALAKLHIDADGTLAER